MMSWGSTDRARGPRPLAVGVVTIVLLAVIALDGHHIWRMITKFPAVATILLFVLTQLITLGTNLWNDLVQTSRVTAGLLDEIVRNLRINAQGNLNAASVEMMKEAVAANVKVRPMIVVVYQDNFYRGIARDLPLIPTRQLQSVNDFYFNVLQLRSVAESIERETFFLLTIPGRQSLFDDLLEAFNDTVRAGEAAKSILQEKTGFRRFFS